MSAKERDQMVAIKAVHARQITQKQAAQQLGRTERQVRRILQRYRAEGDAGLIHRSRGRPSNRRIDPEVKERALVLVIIPGTVWITVRRTVRGYTDLTGDAGAVRGR